MPPGDEKLGKTELTLSAQRHPSFLSSPLFYPMHQLKLSRCGPLVSTGSVRHTKRGRCERYSGEVNRRDLQRGGGGRKKTMSPGKMDRQTWQRDWRGIKGDSAVGGLRRQDGDTKADTAASW